MSRSQVADLAERHHGAHVFHLDVWACGIDPRCRVAVAAIQAGAKGIYFHCRQSRTDWHHFELISGKRRFIIYAIPKSQATDLPSG